MTAPTVTRTPLLVIPMPCDARLLFRLTDAVTKVWERDHPGQRMTLSHLERRDCEFGRVLIVWDTPAGGAR